MAELEAQIVDTGAALKKFNEEKNSKKSIEAEQHLKRLRKQYEEAKHGVENYRNALKSIDTRNIEELTRMKKALNKEIKKLAPNTEEYLQRTKEFKQVEGRIRSLEKAYKDTGAAQQGWLQRLNGVSSGLLLITKWAGMAINAVRRFADAYKTISNFEQANANLASILGATSDQMEVLEKAAIQLGSSTRYSASQVTGLQTELAKLGFTVKEITDMSPAVLNFAGSVGTDLASAASLAGVALRSFNLGSEQTEDALGTMAVACNKSALSFEYLQNSFSTIAPVAKTYGLSLKDTIALLGTLANAGFDASSAATATRNILLNLSDTNGKLAKALGGSVHSFEDIMEAMRKLRDQGVDLNTTLELTDKRSVAAFNTFLDGAESAITLRDELENVNGELQKMAEQRANTVEGAIDGMKSAWEGLVLSFKNSTGTFAKVFKFLTDGINGIRDLMDPEGSIEERTSKMYADMFRNIGNEFISIEETRERVWAKYQELEKSIREGGGGAVYKKHALEGLKKAYNEVMPELTEMAKAANEKVLEINSQYMNEEQRILKQQAKLTENGLNQSNKAAYDKLQEQLEANRKAWNQAVADATRFKEKMEDVVSGDTTTTTNGSGTGGGGVDEKELKKQEAARKKAFADRKAQLEAFYNYETKMMKVKMLQGKMDEAEYNAAVKEKKEKLYADFLALAEKYKQDDSSIRNAILDDQIKDMEAANKAAQKELDDLLKQQKTWEEENLKEWQEWQKKLEEMTREADEIKAELDPSTARQNEMKAELDRLKELHAAMLLEDEEYAKAAKAIEKRYADEALQEKLTNVEKYAEKAKSIMEGISNFAIALKDYETQMVEAEYQAQLAAAGDSAAQREAIELSYREKNLEIQKKYADVEMAINIAKVVADSIVACMKAFKDYGAIGGGIMSALIAASAAVSIAQIVSQRNAIKNQKANVSRGSYHTNSGGGGTGDNGKIGSRFITGYAEGGYTKGHTTLTTVGEKGVEYVIPHWMVQRNPVMVANLERYRKAGSHGRSGSMQRGFADGGFTPSTPNAGIMYDEELLAVLKELKQSNNILQQQLAQGIHADVALSELNRKQKILNKFKQKTSAL